jgi:hypothetical protein
MGDTEMGAGPEFDVPDYQPMEDGTDFPLEPGEGVGARSDAWRSRSPSAQKRVSQGMNSCQYSTRHPDIPTGPQRRPRRFWSQSCFPFVLISI